MRFNLKFNSPGRKMFSMISNLDIFSVGPFLAKENLLGSNLSLTFQPHQWGMAVFHYENVLRGFFSARNRILSEKVFSTVLLCLQEFFKVFFTNWGVPEMTPPWIIRLDFAKFISSGVYHIITKEIITHHVTTVLPYVQQSAPSSWVTCSKNFKKLEINNFNILIFEMFTFFGQKVLFFSKKPQIFGKVSPTKLTFSKRNRYPH